LSLRNRERARGYSFWLLLQKRLRDASVGQKPELIHLLLSCRGKPRSEAGRRNASRSHRHTQLTPARTPLRITIISDTGVLAPGGPASFEEISEFSRGGAAGAAARGRVCHDYRKLEI